MQGALWGSNTKRATGRGGNPPGGLQRTWGSPVLLGYRETGTALISGCWRDMRRHGSSDRHWHFWDTGHQGNGTCSGLGVPGDQAPTDSGGAGDLWALGGYWAGSRRAVIPTLATMGVCEMET